MDGVGNAGAFSAPFTLTIQGPTGGGSGGAAGQVLTSDSYGDILTSSTGSPMAEATPSGTATCA